MASHTLVQVQSSNPQLAPPAATTLRVLENNQLYSEELGIDLWRGPVTVNIFLREMRPFWAKADPDPLPVVKRLVKRLAIDLNSYKRNSLTFVRIEAGLVRRRHELAA